MSRRRILASILAVTLAVLSVAGAVATWSSDSATFEREITAASDFGDHLETKKVWVCKLVGPPDSPHLKAGDNPIHVSVDSTDAIDGFAEDHPSLVVDGGDVDCEAALADKSEITESEPAESTGAITTTTSTQAVSSSTTSTTTTSTPDTSTTSPTTSEGDAVP